MPKPPGNLIEISPPNLDRTGYLTLQSQLISGRMENGREWVMDRLSDGMQARMLRGKDRGYIEFAPFRASWLPLLGARDMVVIETLQADRATTQNGGAVTLLQAAEDWARYFGFSAVLAIEGPVTTKELLTAHGYRLIDEAEAGGALWAQVLQGPLTLPRLPRDWSLRASRMGPDLVVQLPARCQTRLTAAHALMVRARTAGLPVRLDLLTCAQEAKERLVYPGSAFSVCMNGRLISVEPMPVPQIWDRVLEGWPDGGQSPSNSQSA